MLWAQGGLSCRGEARGAPTGVGCAQHPILVAATCLRPDAHVLLYAVVLADVGSLLRRWWWRWRRLVLFARKIRVVARAGARHVGDGHLAQPVRQPLSVLAAVLTDICLCNVCSRHDGLEQLERLRRNGRGQSRRGG
eukprot:COSAG01_NODE_3392_length_6150_cov_6.923814_7_plen_137_part_00